MPSSDNLTVLAPPLPDDLTGNELDPDVRRELDCLPTDVAGVVSRHLVAAGLLVDDSPESALTHARYARSLAPDLPPVREAAGIAAYCSGQWAEALGDLRAASRVGSGSDYLPILADIERALGRPQRAIEFARSPATRELDRDAAIELAIVAAGAHRDVGDPNAAVNHLEPIIHRLLRSGSWNPRLLYAYADSLHAASRVNEAIDWFRKTAMADPDGETDAQVRLSELTGVLPALLDVMFVDDDVEPTGSRESTEAAGKSKARVRPRGGGAITDQIPGPRVNLPMATKSKTDFEPSSSPAASAGPRAEIMLESSPLEAATNTHARPPAASASTSEETSPAIFISYRRSDEAGFAGRLYDRLRQRFGATRIFMDVGSIELGRDFVDALESALQRCAIAIVIIGSRWLGAVDEDGYRRLDNPEDFVRAEIEGALQRDICVVPVLVDKAQMPRKGDLPEAIRPLTRRQGHRISHDQFDSDCATLIAALERRNAETKPKPPETASSPNVLTLPSATTFRSLQAWPKWPRLAPLLRAEADRPLPDGHVLRLVPSDDTLNEPQRTAIQTLLDLPDRDQVIYVLDELLVSSSAHGPRNEEP